MQLGSSRSVGLVTRSLIEAHHACLAVQAQRPQDWMSAPMRPIQSLQLAQRIEAAGPEGLPLAELREAAEELGLDYEMVSRTVCKRLQF